MIDKEEIILEEIYKVLPYCKVYIDNHYWNADLYEVRIEFFYRGNRLGSSAIIHDEKDVPMLIGRMFESIAREDYESA